MVEEILIKKIKITTSIIKLTLLIITVAISIMEIIIKIVVEQLIADKMELSLILKLKIMI